MGFQIGDRVTQVDRAATRYGKVVAIKTHWRSREMREEPLYKMRYYDPKTGKLMHCPDSRCAAHAGGDVEGCVICGRNLWGDEIKKIDDHDLRFYREHGLITD